MILAVIDTNHLLIMASGGNQSPIQRAWRERKFDLAVSTALLTEFESVLSYNRVQRFLTLSQGKRFIDLVNQRAIIVEPVQNPPPCRDPKDEIVIATAIAAQAQYIVTADKDLIEDEHLTSALAEYNLQAVYPFDFLKLL